MVALMRCLLLALALPLAAFAQGESRPSEAQIKAAFLYKFGEFVQWPPASFARADAPRLAETLAAAKGQALLTVTDTDNAISHGSMINFVAEDQRVRFDIALASAERGQLKISSRLLAVARRVITS